MTLHIAAVLAFIALFIFMIVMAIWISRSYQRAMSQPAGRRLVAWFIIASETVILANAVRLGVDIFSSEQSIPLVLSCLIALLMVGGVFIMIWTGRKLNHLNKDM